MRPAVLLVLTCLLRLYPSQAQPVNGLNFEHIYDPLAEVVMQLNPVIYRDSVSVHYRLKTSNAAPTRYLIKWEKRESFGQRQGTAIGSADTLLLTKSWTTGQLPFVPPEKPWLLMVRVTNIATGKYFYFMRQVEAHYPVNGYLERAGVEEWDTFVSAENTYTVRGSRPGNPVRVSYYRDNFPTPSPPFVVKEIRMDRFLFPDSTFTVSSGASTGPFRHQGVYLAQEDTASERGFAFYVKKSPYPKYNTLEELKGPLLFVTTREENDALTKAGEDKTMFDRVILDITKDKERARNFMRSYFRRVETANFYFTSFKEGWKTDRGMIYIVFGRPDEVYMDGGYEEWRYKSPRQSFRFARAGSVYNPDHSVLVREKGYTEAWYMTIDLWRKSRF